MTHSQQPSIDIICKQIVNYETSEVLQKILNEIYSLPQEPSLEEDIKELVASGIIVNPNSPSLEQLLEEMPEFYYIMYSLTKWRILKNNNGLIEEIVEGRTPREALLALKEKLSTNQ